MIEFSVFFIAQFKTGKDYFYCHKTLLLMEDTAEWG